METLTSLQNPKIKQALKLWKRKERELSSTFLIEGYRELSRAAEAQIEIETLFICQELFLGHNEQQLIALISQRGARVFECTKSVFEKLSYRDRPDGLVAVARQFDTSLSSLCLKESPFFVVAEAIEKPGNLGTILRSSDATHVDGVIVCDQCTDIYNPNVVRASVGTLFTQPVVEASTKEVLTWLRQNGIAILAATPSARACYTEVDLTKPTAIVVGTEQYGLSKTWMKNADLQVKIPMLGVADSLNVAMATTLLLYEVIRQRG